MSNQLNTPANPAAAPERGSKNPLHSAGYYRRILIVAAVLLCCCVGSMVLWRWSIKSGLAEARRECRRGEWQIARTRLDKYLKYYPADPKAHLLMAEAIVNDGTEEPRAAALRAVHHLQQVGGDAATMGTARLQEARLSLLVLQQPARAEHLLAEALKFTPDSFESNFLMWKLLDLTGRHVISREYFWRAYGLSPRAEQSDRLREWFLSEFYPETANDNFYRVLGAVEIGKIPASVNLLVKFRESEPEASFIHAALATYYLENGRPESSLELLKEVPDLSRAMQDPFYVAALFETLVSLGEFEKASRCFERFPQPHSGYLYWRCEGLFRQQVQNDGESAARSYESALTVWPARFDWGLMMRLSECLRKTERQDEAKAIQDRVNHLTKVVLTNENMSLLRDRLRDLRDIDLAREIRDLYEEFKMTEEAAAWEEYRKSLQRFPASFLPSEVETRSNTDYTTQPGHVVPDTVLPER